MKTIELNSLYFNYSPKTDKFEICYSNQKTHLQMKRIIESKGLDGTAEIELAEKVPQVAAQNILSILLNDFTDNSRSNLMGNTTNWVASSEVVIMWQYMLAENDNNIQEKLKILNGAVPINARKQAEMEIKNFLTVWMLTGYSDTANIREEIEKEANEKKYFNSENGGQG